MLNSSFSKSALHFVLVAGAFGLAASTASAQPYGPSGNGAAYRAGPPESVQVTAPRFRTEKGRLNGPLEKVSLSASVRYDDLNLRTRRGARELKWRVYNEAKVVCGHLAMAYPVYELNGTSCFKSARDDALVRADAAIRDARESRRYGS